MTPQNFQQIQFAQQQQQQLFQQQQGGAAASSSAGPTAAYMGKKGVKKTSDKELKVSISQMSWFSRRLVFPCSWEF